MSERPFNNFSIKGRKPKKQESSLYLDITDEELDLLEDRDHEIEERLVDEIRRTGVIHAMPY